MKDMKTQILFYWTLLLFPPCSAQCTLYLPESVLLNALNTAGLIVDSDPSMFTLLDLTYLCYARSPIDKAIFDQVRVSLLYTYDTVEPQSAQATFVCFGIWWSLASISSVTQYKHFAQNMTREGCQDCLDDSIFASPTFCRCECHGQGLHMISYVKRKFWTSLSVY